MRVTPGATNVSLYAYFVDDDGGTAPGEPTTGKLFSDIETGGSASYMRQGAARTDVTLVTLASASAGHSDGGFILVDDNNMPGLYRVDVPDAAFAVGVDFVIVQMVMASGNNSIMRPLLVELTASQTGDSFARLGAPVGASIAADITTVDTVVDGIQTDLDNGTDGLGAIKADTAASLLDTNELQGDWVNGGRLDLILDAIPITAMRGTDSAALASVCTEARLAELDAANLPADIDLVLADTGELQTDWANGGRLDLLLDAVSLEATVAALNDLSAANVNSEVVDVLKTDVITLPGQEVPPLTPTFEQAVAWLYKVFRNQKKQTATLWSLLADDEITVDAKATVSDDGTTAVKQEVVAGP